jgi:tetratricopeptide (TPR) repeat protein
MSLAELGRFAEAAEHATEALRLAEPTQSAYAAVQACRAATLLHLLEGNWARAHSLIEQGIAVIRTRTLGFVLPDAIAVSAWVLAQLDEADQALDRIREGEQLLERHLARGFVGRFGWDYQALGRAALLLGRRDEAEALGKRAIQAAERHPGFKAYAQQLLGDIATHPDRFEAERGEAYYRQALALAEPRGMRPLVAHCHLGLGKLYRRTGQHDLAREHLTAATTLYRQMEMRFWLPEVEAELADSGQ